jgi:hypothetical protein
MMKAEPASVGAVLGSHLSFSQEKTTVVSLWVQLIIIVPSAAWASAVHVCLQHLVWDN